MSIQHCTVQGPSVTFRSEHPLSNLYECKVTLHGLTFPSAEHAYQYIQRVDNGNHEDWTVGKFADAKYVTGVAREWKKIKKGPVGTLAKIVVSHPKTFGIKLKPRNTLDISKERWFPILRAKFQGELKELLLNTTGTLVQLDEKARVRPGKWGGLVQKGVLYGPNIMGHMLTAFRDDMRRRAPKRKRDIEEIGHMNAEQAVQAKFKKAGAEGRVVDLSQHESTGQRYTDLFKKK